MKNRMTLNLCFVLLSAAAQGQAPEKNFSVQGTVIGASEGKVALHYEKSTGTRVTDSIQVVNGRFVFSGTIKEPTNAWLENRLQLAGKDRQNGRQFFLEPGTVTIMVPADNFEKATVTGSKTQEEANGLKAKVDAVYAEMKPLSDAYSVANKEIRLAEQNKRPEAEVDTLKYRAAAIHAQFDPYFQRIARIHYDFFDANPSSYVTGYNLRYYTGRWGLDTLEYFYNKMNAELQQSAGGKDLAKEIKKLKAGSPGAMAANFTAKELKGKNISLADFKGKYVLLDFWASWCVPCRKSMPHMKELYAAYKAKGLEIIAVADDASDHDAWKKAIEKDGTGKWYNVLRGLNWDKINKGEENPDDISEKFGIHSLPTKILINREGTIIGRYEESNEASLDGKLAEVLGNGK